MTGGPVRLYCNTDGTVNLAKEIRGKTYHLEVASGDRLCWVRASGGVGPDGTQGGIFKGKIDPQVFADFVSKGGLTPE